MPKTPEYALSLSLLAKCGMYHVGETTEDYRDTHWAPVRLHIVTALIVNLAQPRWPRKNVSIGDCLYWIGLLGIVLLVLIDVLRSSPLWVAPFPESGSWTVQQWRSRAEHKQASRDAFLPFCSRLWLWCDQVMPSLPLNHGR